MKETTGKIFSGFFYLLIIVIFFTLSCNSEVHSITIRITHLLYPDYSQTIKVKMYEKFQLSDSDLFAAVVEFVPDFAIDTVTNKVVSLSQELRNPAFKIYVVKGKEKKEESWAFFKSTVPHFTRQSGLMFEVLEFELKGKIYHRRESQ